LRAIRAAVDDLTCADRVGASLTAIAPPPMIAPPQVTAQSLARAMRTVMLIFPLLRRDVAEWPDRTDHKTLSEP